MKATDNLHFRRTFQGATVVSVMRADGSRAEHQYMGYTRREIVRDFRSKYPKEGDA